MPRDSDKNNDSRGRRDRPGGGKGRSGGSKARSGAARGPEKKFAKRGFAGKGEGEGERRHYPGKFDVPKSFGKKAYSGGRKPYAGKRDGDDRPPRRDFGDAPRPRGDRPFAGRPSRGDDGEKRSFKPREDRGGGDKRPRSEERRVGKECRCRCARCQAEDGIRDHCVTGVQTCALPIFRR